ncbi:YggT family protein [Chloroflexota bacterium]
MSGLISIIAYIIDALTFLIFLRVIFSWFQVSPRNSLVMFIYQLTEPILAPLRRIIPPIGMMDITPLIAVVLLRIISAIIVAAF